MTTTAETTDPIRSAWVRYLLALQGSSMKAAAELAGVHIRNVSRVVSGRRGAGDAEAPTADAVWSALETLTGHPAAVLQHPPTVLPPDVARLLTRAG